MPKRREAKWRPWERDPNVKFQIEDKHLRIQFWGGDVQRRSGWMRLLTGDEGATIRQHLSEMAKGDNT